VNKTEGGPACPTVAGQQTMAVGEEFLSFEQGRAEVLGRVVIMVQVQVQLNLAEAGPAEFGQGVEMLGIVLLDREEERVAGRPPLAVAKAAEPSRIVAHPPLDPLAGHLGEAPPTRGSK
jgi:hypothetical protein